MIFKTPHEQWLHKKDLQEKRRANWTPEQWEEHRKKRRSICNRWYHKSEQDDHPLHVIHQERRKEKWIKLTPEEKSERTKYQRKRRENFTAEELEKERERGRRNIENMKFEVLYHYSYGTMTCMNPNCEVPGGSKNPYSLCVEHINGGGKKHSEELKKQGIHIYRWLLKNNFPEGFQNYCANCNMLKKKYNKEDYRSPPGSVTRRTYRRKVKEIKDVV